MSDHLIDAPAAGPDLAGLAASGDWRFAVTTRSGLRVRIRRAEPQDRAAVADLFAHVGPEGLRRRFLTCFDKVPDETLGDLVKVDDPLYVDFLATRLSDGLILASGVLAAQPGLEMAEIALATRDDYKGKGVSWSLLEHILRFAAAAGVARVRSFEAWDDVDALALEREMGFDVRLAADDACLMIAEKMIG